MQSYPEHSLAATALEVWRGDRLLCSGLDLTLSAGQLGLLAGPNGSGKTTLLRVFSGLRRAEAGDLSLDGAPIRDDLPAYRRKLAYLGHQAPLKPELTLAENLRFQLRLRGRADAAPDLEGSGLAGLETRPARQLSAGQRRRASLAAVAAAEAPIWFLDEPYTSLDAAGDELLENMLARHLARGGLAWVATHRRPGSRLTPSVEHTLGSSSN